MLAFGDKADITPARCRPTLDLVSFTAFGGQEPTHCWSCLHCAQAFGRQLRPCSYLKAVRGALSCNRGADRRLAVRIRKAPSCQLRKRPEGDLARQKRDWGEA